MKINIRPSYTCAKNLTSISARIQEVNIMAENEKVFWLDSDEDISELIEAIESQSAHPSKSDSVVPAQLSLPIPPMPVSTQPGVEVFSHIFS